jgi:hypothetical protein
MQRAALEDYYLAETDEHIKCLFNETLRKTTHLESPVDIITWERLKEDQEMALKLSMTSGLFQIALPHSDRRTYKVLDDLMIVMEVLPKLDGNLHQIQHWKLIPALKFLISYWSDQSQLWDQHGVYYVDAHPGNMLFRMNEQGDLVFYWADSGKTSDLGEIHHLNSQFESSVQKMLRYMKENFAHLPELIIFVYLVDENHLRLSRQSTPPNSYFKEMTEFIFEELRSNFSEQTQMELMNSLHPASNLASSILRVIMQKRERTAQNEINNITQWNQKLVKDSQVWVQEKELLNKKIQALTQDNKLLTHENRALTQDKELLNNENRALTEDKELLNKKIQALTQDNKLLTHENRALTQDKELLNNENRALTEDKELLNKKIQALTQDNKLLTHENRALTQDKELLKNENQALTEDKELLAQLMLSKDIIHKQEIEKLVAFRISQDLLNEKNSFTGMGVELIVQPNRSAS